MSISDPAVADEAVAEGSPVPPALVLVEGEPTEASEPEPRAVDDRFPESPPRPPDPAATKRALAHLDD